MPGAYADGMSMISTALAPFGTTIFATISRLALEHKAVNLGQGFPDFDGPDWVKDAVARALRDEPNQYAPMPGVPALREAIADRWRRHTGLAVDPSTEVTVTAGCTEAIAAALLGICNPGDEVVMFEPFYDSYRACAAMAGVTIKPVTLRARFAADSRSIESFDFDAGELWDAFSERTRAVIVNTPHNPTGKVFSQSELGLIADACMKHGCVAIVDEVYDRLVFEPAVRPHVHLAAVPGMAERTINLNSLGKTFSLTGWKIGWAVAPGELTAAVRAAHQFLTFAVATPLQHGAAAALRREDEYVPELIARLGATRAELFDGLRGLGFVPHLPAGGYFVIADFVRAEGAGGGTARSVAQRLGVADDAALCRAMIERLGVAAIPPSVFYARPEHGRSLVRFAFCKRAETVRAALQRLSRLAELDR